MLRTQIYLPEEFHAELSYLAAKKGLPMAALVRKILAEGLAKKERFLEPENDLEKLTNLKLKGGPKDLSKNFDRYLYENPR